MFLILYLSSSWRSPFLGVMPQSDNIKGGCFWGVLRSLEFLMESTSCDNTSQPLAIEIHRNSRRTDCKIQNSDRSEHTLSTTTLKPSIHKVTHHQTNQRLYEIHSDESLWRKHIMTIHHICKHRWSRKGNCKRLNAKKGNRDIDGCASSDGVSESDVSNGGKGGGN